MPIPNIHNIFGQNVGPIIYPILGMIFILARIKIPKDKLGDQIEIFVNLFVILMLKYKIVHLIEKYNSTSK